MKFCPTCHLTYDDSANVCAQCGGPLALAQIPAVDMTDHTAEFDPEDISKNKVLAMASYILGFIGILIAVIAGGSSPYAAFHVRQSLKIRICFIILALVNFIPILGWIAYAVCVIILLVVNLICFFDVCKGKAKEPAIIKNFAFLK